MKDQDDTQVTTVFTDMTDAPTLEHKPRILHVNVEKFQHHLDDCDLSDAEKAEYLHLIWSIILEFIDLGYGIHPVQEFCGQIQESIGQPASQGEGVVGSEDQNTPEVKKTDAKAGSGEKEDS